MALETVTYISDLVVTNPTATDQKQYGDDHIRNIKSGLKTTFPNVAGAVTPSHVEFNYLVGVTSGVQAQFDAHTSALALKAPLASPALTGTPTAPTAAPGTNNTQIASTAFVLSNAAPLASPAFTGTPTAPTASAGTGTTQIATCAFTLNAVAAVNAQAPMVTQIVTGTTQAGSAGNHYVMTNAAACTLTLPASPAAGDELWVTFTNGLYTNVIARNGKTIYGDSVDFTINAGVRLTWKWKYINNDWIAI